FKTPSTMRKDIGLRPSEKVELRPGRQEREALMRDAEAVLPFQHPVELLLQGVKVQNVRGRVVELRLRQGFRAPVGGLLLLGDFDAEQLPREILQPVPIRI